MNIIIDIILCIIQVVATIVLMYFTYQMIRLDSVYKIRDEWVEKKDKRKYKYSFEYMIDPNLHNWFGLRYPKDKHYK